MKSMKDMKDAPQCAKQRVPQLFMLFMLFMVERQALRPELAVATYKDTRVCLHVPT